jgi:hypothetical protein
MRFRAIAPTAGAALFLACVSQRPASCGAPGRPAPTPPEIVAASSDPVPSASPGVASPPPGEPAIACAAACAAGTACALTKRGPACVACAPGALPTCKDDRFVAVCTDDGALQTTTDCFAQKKRCVSGTCQSRACTPNALHCFEGNVARCNAAGTDRVLVTTCQIDDGVGGLTVDKGVCQVRRGVPACHTDCFEPDSTILALFGCTPCEPPPGDFCATEGRHGCNDRICRLWPDSHNHAISGPWGAEGPCLRETDGLAVPGSDRRGTCEGAGTIGERVISYEVCHGGHAVGATRAEPCIR